MISEKPSFQIFSARSESGRRFFVRLVFLCLILPVFLMSCEKIKALSRPSVATVNGSKIYLDDYQLQLDKKMTLLPVEVKNQTEDLKRFKEEVLDDMITEKIMEMRARELNLSVSETELADKIKDIRKDYGEDFTALFAEQNINFNQWKEEFKKEMLLRKLIDADVNSRIKISDEEAEGYFNKHRGDYKRDARVRIAQIVVKEKAAAEKALSRLKAGEDFAKVAADMSIGPEAKKGGDLGFITRMVMPEQLDKTIFKIPVNQISPIVQSSYGFHIFKVLEKQQEKDGSYLESKDDVMADLREQKEEAAFTTWLQDLRKKAVVKKKQIP